MSTSEIDRLQRTLGDAYRVERELGVGGMATVYLARDMRHDRDVAIKVLKPDLGVAVGAERFLNEIRTTARLQHPHILPLFDSGARDGCLYYVMPVARGESLRDRLNRERQLSVKEAARIASEIASALAHAHASGIVHRDIKPENVLLQDDGFALVLDFGIGKVFTDVTENTLTQAGVSIGTPAYMSPEQAVGEHVDGRSDIYSLGCVLYEMLVGEPPFTGANAQAVIAKRFVQTPADVTALREGVPRAVARTVRHALQRAPIDRHETAAAFVAELQHESASESVDDRSAPLLSIAVLPFTSLSDDRENEYFGDGVAEDVTNALARIDGLHVAARTSAFSYKGRPTDLRTIGEQLHVATVLQGSVRKAGHRIRIVAQLVAVVDGYQLWSERYDRELVDVFAVQDEIAGAIADRLALTFQKPRDRAPVTPQDVELYELVVRGRALSRERGRAILESVACFERALVIDADSADALAGLGHALRVKAQYGFASAAECLPRAITYLERALAIDPDHVEALGYLAATMINHGLPMAGARKLWERAMELDPRHAEIRGLFAVWGLLVGGLGMEDVRGETELRRATTDDPRNAIVCAIGAIGFSQLLLNSEAIACARRGCEANPAAFAPAYSLVWALEWSGDAALALVEAESALEKFGRHPYLLHSLTGIYMALNDHVRAEAIHAELLARAVTSRIPNFSLCVSAIALGRMDEAMTHALESARVHDGLGPVWWRNVWADALHGHPRHGELRAAYPLV